LEDTDARWLTRTDLREAFYTFDARDAASFGH